VFEGKETAMPRLLLTSVVFALLALMAWTAAAADPAVLARMNVDYRSLVSRADLDYNEPVSRSEEGMPVGNGRMGSLVWTTPTALKLQINRVDVFAHNCETNSFPVRDSDYGSGCGYVDIDFVDFGQDVFTGTAFRQHLSLYDALMTARGD
jgi:alpha-L-fucosidase 2